MLRILAAVLQTRALKPHFPLWGGQHYAYNLLGQRPGQSQQGLYPRFAVRLLTTVMSHTCSCPFALHLGTARGHPVLCPLHWQGARGTYTPAVHKLSPCPSHPQAVPLCSGALAA